MKRFTVTVNGTLGTDVELYIDYGKTSTLVATPEVSSLTKVAEIVTVLALSE